MKRILLFWLGCLPLLSSLAGESDRKPAVTGLVKRAIVANPVRAFVSRGSPIGAAGPDPFADLDAAAPGQPLPSSSSDPFADLDASRSPNPLFSTPATGSEQSPSSAPAIPGRPKENAETSFLGGLLGEGFSFKKELMFELSRSSEAAHMPGATAEGLYSRNSIGFEILKKFSTDTATVAAFDLQMRLVRRDNFHEVLSDMEGANRRGWFLEYHNFYWDLYNVFNPLFGDEARGRNAGRFNLRVGRFYLPFGLNLQTDTHGTLLQLSNERNFGFERDWYAGFWGSINAHLNYDIYYLLGSGYDFASRGQSGLIGTRLSLSNKYLNEYGIEGGVSFLSGQRISKDAFERSPSVAMVSKGSDIVETLRYGGDLRWRHPIPTGSITLTSELSAGRDERDKVFTQLYQADYLTLNRKFGASVQYRRFNQDIQGSTAAGGMNNNTWNGGKTDASIIGELTWYFRNDLGNTNLHWVKLNVERETESQRGRYATITTLQYYRYW